MKTRKQSKRKVVLQNNLSPLNTSEIDLKKQWQALNKNLMLRYKEAQRLSSSPPDAQQKFYNLIIKDHEGLLELIVEEKLTQKIILSEVNEYIQNLTLLFRSLINTDNPPYKTFIIGMNKLKTTLNALHSITPIKIVEDIIHKIDVIRMIVVEHETEKACYKWRNNDISQEECQQVKEENLPFLSDFIDDKDVDKDQIKARVFISRVALLNNDTDNMIKHTEKALRIFTSGQLANSLNTIKNIEIMSGAFLPCLHHLIMVIEYLKKNHKFTLAEEYNNKLISVIQKYTKRYTFSEKEKVIIKSTLNLAKNTYIPLLKKFNNQRHLVDFVNHSKNLLEKLYLEALHDALNSIDHSENEILKSIINQLISLTSQAEYVDLPYPRYIRKIAENFSFLCQEASIENLIKLQLTDCSELKKQEEELPPYLKPFIHYIKSILFIQTFSFWDRLDQCEQAGLINTFDISELNKLITLHDLYIYIINHFETINLESRNSLLNLLIPQNSSMRTIKKTKEDQAIKLKKENDLKKIKQLLSSQEIYFQLVIEKLPQYILKFNDDKVKNLFIETLSKMKLPFTLQEDTFAIELLNITDKSIPPIQSLLSNFSAKLSMVKHENSEWQWSSSPLTSSAKTAKQLSRNARRRAKKDKDKNSIPSTVPSMIPAQKAIIPTQKPLISTSMVDSISTQIPYPVVDPLKQHSTLPAFENSLDNRRGGKIINEKINLFISPPAPPPPPLEFQSMSKLQNSNLHMNEIQKLLNDREIETDTLCRLLHLTRLLINIHSTSTQLKSLRNSLIHPNFKTCHNWLENPNLLIEFISNFITAHSEGNSITQALEAAINNTPQINTLLKFEELKGAKVSNLGSFSFRKKSQESATISDYIENKRIITSLQHCLEKIQEYREKLQNTSDSEQKQYNAYAIEYLFLCIDENLQLLPNTKEILHLNPLHNICNKIKYDGNSELTPSAILQALDQHLPTLEAIISDKKKKSKEEKKKENIAIFHS